MRKIIAVAWFTDSSGRMGIVITQSDDKNFRAWLGTCTQNTVDEDMVHICHHGAKFPLLPALLIMESQGEILDDGLYLQLTKQEEVSLNALRAAEIIKRTSNL